jgi:hypothetical protein
MYIYAKAQICHLVRQQVSHNHDPSISGPRKKKTVRTVSGRKKIFRNYNAAVSIDKKKREHHQKLVMMPVRSPIGEIIRHRI